MKKINKRLLYGSGSLALTALFIAAVLLVNLLVSQLTNAFSLRKDLSANGVVSLSGAFTGFLKSIDRDIDVYYVVEDLNLTNEVRSVLERMEQVNPHIDVQLTDYKKDPELVQKYSGLGTDVAYGDIIFDAGEQYKAVAYNDLFFYNEITGSTSFEVEEKFSSALSAVLRDETCKIGMLVSHGEYKLTAMTDIFDDEGMVYEDFDIMVNGISPDYDVVIAYGPAVDFSAQELELLDAYLEQGGNMIIYLDPTAEPMPVLEEYLAEWGVEILPGIVREQGSNTLQYDGWFNTEMQSHAITDVLLEEGLTAAMHNPKALRITSAYKNGVGCEELLATSASAEISDLEQKGPYSVATLSTKTYDNGNRAKLLLYGTYELVDAGLTFNRYLLVNSVLTLSEKAESYHFAAKTLQTSTLEMTGQEVITWQFLLTIFLPLLILLAGVIVWFRRRNL